MDTYRSDSFEITQGFINDFFSNIGPELASQIPGLNEHFFVGK